MRAPTTDGVSRLTGKLDVFYAEWLRIGLTEYVHGSGKRTAFTYVSAYIGLREGIAEDLTDIFDVLPIADQVEFQKGCARALEELDLNNAADAALAEILIRLGANVKAYQILSVLAGKSFFNLSIPGADRLYNLALDVSQELAGPSHVEAAACLAHIIRQLGAKVQPSQARTALLGLALAAPKNLVEHMRLLARPLTDAYGYGAALASLSDLQSARRDLILEVASRVPFDDVLELASDPALRFPEADPFFIENMDWWFKTIWDDQSLELDCVRNRLKGQTPKLGSAWADLLNHWKTMVRPLRLDFADVTTIQLANDPLFGDPDGPFGKALLDGEYPNSSLAGAA